MVYAPAPNVVQLVAQYISVDQICENVLHFSSGGAPTVTTMNALIDAYVNWENTSAKGLRSVRSALLRCIATDLSSSTGAVVDRAILPQVNGTVAGAQCPNNVTLAISVHTAKRGRSYRGRVFWIGMPTSLVNDNFVLAGQQANLVGTYSLLLALGVAPIFNLGVLSSQQDKVKINPRIFTPATAITVDGVLDSQRRRLPNHNRHG